MSEPFAAEIPGLFPRPLLAEVSAYLRLHQHQWRALDVSRVQVFGSVARGEAQEASDVDVLIEFGHPAGLISQVRAIWLFEGLLGRRTDVVTEAALKPQLRGAVLNDAVDVMAPAPSARPAATPKRWHWRLQELTALLERLAALVAPLDLEGFRADQTVQDAACMGLLRLGEGTKFIPQEVQDAHPEVPWAELRGLRNLIAHDYFGLDLQLLWHTLTTELPLLMASLSEVSDRRPDESPAAAPAETSGSEAAR